MAGVPASAIEEAIRAGHDTTSAGIAEFLGADLAEVRNTMTDMLGAGDLASEWTGERRRFRLREES